MGLRIIDGVSGNSIKPFQGKGKYELTQTQGVALC